MDSILLYYILKILNVKSGAGISTYSDKAMVYTMGVQPTAYWRHAAHQVVICDPRLHL